MLNYQSNIQAHLQILQETWISYSQVSIIIEFNDYI